MSESLIDQLDRRSQLYRASRVLYDAAGADLRESVEAALRAGYRVTDLVGVVGYSRPQLYQIAKSVDLADRNTMGAQ